MGVWYNEEGPERAAALPSPLFAVPNVTAHPSTASVLITVLLYNGQLHCNFNVPIKGLNIKNHRRDPHRSFEGSQFPLFCTTRLVNKVVGVLSPWVGIPLSPCTTGSAMHGQCLFSQHHYCLVSTTLCCLMTSATCSESCVMAGNANHYIATPQYSNRRCSNIKAFFVDF